ncbi:MAG TPA: KEOPS complex kinase/ATPase Bud32 [Nitrososphaeraceae archaeon]|nr:KEOPS complex kinase/ATPase Bud32 [Nitrososphaeraceae archaeon]
MHYGIIKRGAEADVFLILWYKQMAISKLRNPKKYRNITLDNLIRRRRTIHEANMLHDVKKIGIKTPFLYFVDPKRAEIIMEYIDGENVKDILSKEIGFKIGKYVSNLHNKNIIHGDLNTSNFIKRKEDLYLIDFGLSFYSERIEDMATDIRIIKEILSSAHIHIFDETYESFLEGYALVTNNNFKQILKVVKDIEGRGRYARVV